LRFCRRASAHPGLLSLRRRVLSLNEARGLCRTHDPAPQGARGARLLLAAAAPRTSSAIE
jgi:hypothetical protein